MNERVTFVVAVLGAEWTASTVYYLSVPSSPWTDASPSLFSYAVQHGFLVSVVWVVVLAVAWLSVGPHLVRLRQNLASKLGILVKAGVAGVALDNAVSLYQLSATPEAANPEWTSIPVVLGIAIRSGVYTVTFALAVLVSYVISRTQRSPATPPPRFGRE